MQTDAVFSAFFVQTPKQSTPAKASPRTADFNQVLETLSAEEAVEARTTHTADAESNLQQVSERENRIDKPLDGENLPGEAKGETRLPDDTEETEDHSASPEFVVFQGQLPWMAVASQTISVTDFAVPREGAVEPGGRRQHLPVISPRVFPEQLNWHTTREISVPSLASEYQEILQADSQVRRESLTQHITPMQGLGQAVKLYDMPEATESFVDMVPELGRQLPTGFETAQSHLSRDPKAVLPHRSKYTSALDVLTENSEGEPLPTEIALDAAVQSGLVSVTDEADQPLELDWEPKLTVYASAEDQMNDVGEPVENLIEPELPDPTPLVPAVGEHRVSGEPQSRASLGTEMVTSVEQMPSRESRNHVQLAPVANEEFDAEVEAFEDVEASEEPRKLNVEHEIQAASRHEHLNHVRTRRVPEQSGNGFPELVDSGISTPLQRQGAVPLESADPIIERPLQLYEAADAIPELAERMQAVLTTERSEVRIQLKPEHLGELKIRVAVEQGVVSAEFVAESQAVKSLIEASLPELRTALQNMGSTVSELAVFVGGHEQPSDRRHNQGQPQWQQTRRLDSSRLEDAAAVTTYSRDPLTQIDLRV